MEGVFKVTPEVQIARAWCRLWLLVLIFLCLKFLAMAAESTAATTERAAALQTTNAPAKLSISGYGVLGNRQLRRTLRTLELGGKKPPVFSATFIEDSAMILLARVRRDGFLQPSIRVRLQLTDGSILERYAADLMENPLPRTLEAKRAEFIIEKGTIYYFESLDFEGLQTVSDKQARSYFVETGTLLRLKRSRIFTPEALQRGLASLRAILERQGYRDVTVDAAEVIRNEDTGAVSVRIRVHQGPKYLVRTVEEQVFPDADSVPAQARTLLPNRPYSQVYVQDLQQSLKTNQFAQGFPDTTVEIRPVLQEAEESANQVMVDLAAKVVTGPQVKVGAIDIVGEKRTKETFLSRRIRAKRGDLLNPVRAEQARYDLSRLGIFNSVSLTYEPVDESTRNVTYTVEEGKRFNVNLLFGYGSYELLRGGVEADLYNIWGLAHRASVKLVQSFKSSSGDFAYTIPELLPQSTDFFFDATALRREEVSFLREEYGGGFGIHRFFPRVFTDLTTRYQYQILNTGEANSDFAIEGLTNAAVGSVITDLKFDRRDNPLYPRRGYKLFTTIELASEYLGGEVGYQRMDTALSWHTPLAFGFYFNVGLRHGFVASGGTASEDLPFNRRFFPGGENSIRGYQEGEASPRNAEGKFVGTETYILGTVELETALTRNWSLVFFSDSLGFARRLENYPGDTALYSVGLGVRWRTIVGPVRLEYGHNLNPRPGDPDGTLHFSLGFPF